jgi:multicomponent Na+:H+ antiporter subunit B
MSDRDKGLVNFVGFILVAALAVVIYVAVNAEGGRNVMSASMDERVSAAFITKSVSGENSSVVTFGSSGHEEGSANLVTSIVVNYRAFDTLGEVLVLFAAAAGVGLLFSGKRKRRYRKASLVATTAVPLIAFFAMIVGIFLILHGHITPGGGFSGGALVASGLLLVMFISSRNIPRNVFLVTESIAGLAIIGIGWAGVMLRGEFLANYLPAGSIGDLLSGGTVLILYILVGLKVTSEITTIGVNYIDSEE